ncbi:MAG: hypothetical protein Q7V14_02370, partial [Coriobacteriia bacterium]|nr:hypothetical protein [Coriobacteriia bacterium]
MLELGFFLLGRGRDTGDLRLISSVLYSNRADALDALTRLSGELTFEHRDAEVFVLDLDSGVPILLVSTPAAAPVVAINEDTPDEAPAEAEPTLDETPAEEPGDEPAHDAGVWEAPSDVVAVPLTDKPKGTGLAGALKRATGALESEGIVAPESIGPAAVIEEVEPEATWPWDTADKGAGVDVETLAGGVLEP